MKRLALFALVLLTPATAAAGEITVLCPRTVQAVVAAAAESFQRATRHSVWLSYGEVAAVATRALTEEADVVIATVPMLADLEAKAAVRPGTRVALGRVGIGVAVRAGTPLPDLTSTTNLRRAILKASSVGYADPARGAPAAQHFAQVLDMIGIAPLVTFKTMLFPDGPRALESVARGDIELAVASISEILGVSGVALAGPLPVNSQQVLDYAAAVMTRSAAPELARALLAHLASPAVRAQLKAAGMEPTD